MSKELLANVSVTPEGYAEWERERDEEEDYGPPLFFAVNCPKCNTEPLDTSDFLCPSCNYPLNP